MEAAEHDGYCPSSPNPGRMRLLGLPQEQGVAELQADEEWLDPAKRSQHHGFLWMRVKAGAGKSTIMKYLYSEAKKKSKSDPNLVPSFFLNALGVPLEKSIAGMYRSLLHQLLERFPDLQTVLDYTDIVPRHQQGCPSLNSLKELFRSAVSGLYLLRRCSWNRHPASGDIHFRICFSSDVRKGVLLTLEDQPGHEKTWRKLKSEILRKSAGIFMWVVLVVDILNKENNNGPLSVKKKLVEITDKLSDLFERTLIRDQENMERLLLCILWVLCAERPLRPEEFSRSWIPQDDFLSRFFLPTGLKCSTCSKMSRLGNTAQMQALSICWQIDGLQSSFAAWVQKEPNVHILGERYKHPLFAAFANSHKDVVAALLGFPSSFYDGGERD
ncbi:hypothetical protein V1506DRAFT_507619 [Lipomyces tetrasporus]